jgi:hypothetical protein
MENHPMRVLVHTRHRLVGSTALQAAFVTQMPRIVLHARVHFRDVQCPHQKEDAIAETVALAWKWFVRLAERGKDANQFVTALAGYASRAVRSGRRLCGQEKARDVLSRLAQLRHHFVVAGLAAIGSTQPGSAFMEALHDNTQTPVPDQVGFRVDFPRWRNRRCERDRRLIDHLMSGEHTRDAAHRFGLTPGRVSQLRREFHQDWLAFCGESGECGSIMATSTSL